MSKTLLQLTGRVLGGSWMAPRKKHRQDAGLSCGFENCNLRKGLSRRLPDG